MSLDPNLRKELLAHGQTEKMFADLVGKADLLLPSGAELFLAAGAVSEERAIAALFERGVKEIAVKRGPEGASVYHHTGTRTDYPGFVDDESAPTGASATP
ncbi:hypothetical protein COL154_014071 [Colletotrichum chrysophilum]|nr:hypothetical protein COL154_014071 [Colletotrichum chrysophilum]